MSRILQGPGPFEKYTVYMYNFEPSTLLTYLNVLLYLAEAEVIFGLMLDLILAGFSKCFTILNEIKPKVCN